MHLSSKILRALEGLRSLDVTISEILLSLLLSQPEELDRLALNSVNDLISNHFTILDAFRAHSTFARGTQDWIHYQASEDMIVEVNRLTHISTGWHGNAHKARIEQFETLNAGSIASTAKNVAPRIWTFFDRLLNKRDISEVEGDQIIDEDVSEGREADSRLGIVKDRAAKLRELVCIVVSSIYTHSLLVTI